MYTDEQIEALRKALAQGVRSVSYDGRTVTYHSLDDMIRLLEHMVAQKDSQERVSRFPARFDKGL